MRIVYVQSNDGRPLMPTHRLGKVRHLLKDGKAKVVKRCPFTIQLTYYCGCYTQPIALGVDTGSKHIGLSATTEKEELYSSDIALRTDIVELISTRRQNRKTRRNRLRYRKPRFNNRVANKEKGWLAPSIIQKIECHIKVIENVFKILPITNIIVEVASFDTQLLKAQIAGLPLPEGKDYQNGEMLGFNVREYVLFRDNYQCQHCKGKLKDEILNVHHIESRKTGGNAPNNLITLCKTCHKAYHDGKIELKVKRGAKFNDAAFMGIMRKSLYNRLIDIYKPKGVSVNLTYGYITKHKRIALGFAKEHYNDAFCIANNLGTRPLNNTIFQKKVRCHNRQIHKANLLKGGKKKLNQAAYTVKGFRLFDKVRYQNIDCFIFGRRTSGSFDIRMLDGTKVNAGISCKKLKLLEFRKSYLSEERRKAFPPITKTMGIHAEAQ